MKSVGRIWALPGTAKPEVVDVLKSEPKLYQGTFDSGHRLPNVFMRKITVIRRHQVGELLRCAEAATARVFDRLNVMVRSEARQV